jgi:hypothetical protein
MVKFIAIPTPVTKKDAATTPNGGVVTIAAYPNMSKISEIIRHFARPILFAKAFMKKAAATNPRALQTKMIETVPYEML